MGAGAEDQFLPRCASCLALQYCSIRMCILRLVVGLALILCNVR